MSDLGIVEAAQLLGVSIDTVRRRIKRGDLPARRDERGHWRVSLDVGETGASTGTAPTRELMHDHVLVRISPEAATVRPAYAALQRELVHTRTLYEEAQRRITFLEQLIHDQREQLTEHAKAEADLRRLLTQAYALASVRQPSPEPTPVL